MPPVLPAVAAGLILLFCGSAVECCDSVVVASGSGSQSPKQPQAAMSSDGVIHVTWGRGDFVEYSQSRNGGASFENETQAFRVPNLSLGMRRGPRIAATRSGIVITAIGGKAGKGKDGDIWAWRSADNGVKWHGPVRVNDAADSAREGLHAMASGPDGSIWCVWLDLRNQKTELYAARSRDAGETWEQNQCVYRSPGGSVCECCHPSVYVTETCVHILFRNSIAGDRDMYLLTSRDGGRSFPEPRKLGTGTWKLDACPMDGGMLGVAGDGTPLTVWRREGRVYLDASDGLSEVQLGSGQQPWVTVTPQGPYIVWTAGRDGDLLCQSPKVLSPVKLASAARDPIVISGGDGNGPVVAFWESKQGDESVVMAVRINAAE